MLWTREAVVLFAKRAIAEYCREKGSMVEEELSRKARVIDFDAVKTLKKGDARVIVTSDVDRFYVSDFRRAKPDTGNQEKG